MKEKILHVDGDAFFAACEMARFPMLWNKPLVVGHSIASAMSYEAKKLGVHRAMPIFEVKKTFPHMAVIGTHFELYHMYGDKLSSVLSRYTDRIERYSVDECFAILTESEMNKYGTWENFLLTIKNDVQSTLGITFSFGLADTKVLAKVASKYEKPNGLTYISESNREKVLKKVPIENIWGVGRATAKNLQKMGVKNAYQFVKLSESYVDTYFHKPLAELWHELCGRRIMNLSDSMEIDLAKSFQSMRTFKPATDNKIFIASELSNNVEIVCARMRESDLVTKNISIVLKQGEYNLSQIEVVMPNYTNSPSDILNYLESSFDKLFIGGTKYRQTGFVAANLKPRAHIQNDLFNVQNNILENSRGYMSIVDVIHNKFGNSSIGLLSSLNAVNQMNDKTLIDEGKDPYIWNLPLPYLGEIY